MILKPGPKIASGRTAEVFHWKENEVIKLFHEWVSSETVENEARISRAVYDASLPVPYAGETIRIYNRTGLVYRYIDGSSMLETFGNKPWRLNHFAKKLSELHQEIHKCHVPQLPSLKKCLEDKIRTAKGLSDGSKDAVLYLLSNMPEGESLCHGDFHPGNILLSSGGPIIIDWVDAACGNPMADVARTSLLALYAFLPKEMPARKIFGISRRLFHNIYMHHYFKLKPTDRKDLGNWLIINAAARLAENIRDEQDRLKSLIHKSIKAGSLL